MKRCADKCCLLCPLFSRRYSFYQNKPVKKLLINSLNNCESSSHLGVEGKQKKVKQFLLPHMHCGNICDLFDSLQYVAPCPKKSCLDFSMAVPKQEVHSLQGRTIAFYCSFLLPVSLLRTAFLLLHLAIIINRADICMN